MSEDRRKLFVGGLPDNATEALVHAAFLPFGVVLDVSVPVEKHSKKLRGFAFVQFELEEDAAAAMENMDNAELGGSVLRVTIAQSKTSRLGSHKAIWDEDPDKWANRNEKNQENEST